VRFMKNAPVPYFVDTLDDVRRAALHCTEGVDKVLGVDTETLMGMDKSLGNMTDEIVVMGLCPDDQTRYLVPRRNLRYFREALSADTPKALANIKFDAHRFANANIELGGEWWDTVHMDWMLDTERKHHGLKECSKDYLGIEMRPYKTLFGETDPRELKPGHPLWPKYLDYSSLDPWATRSLAIELQRRLGNRLLWHDSDKTLLDIYRETESDQLKTLWRMERRGVRIDVEYLNNLDTEYRQFREILAKHVINKLGRPINVNSPVQLQELLYEEWGLPVLSKTKTGNPSTDAETLEKLAALRPDLSLLRCLGRLKEYDKLIGTYTSGLRKHLHHGRIHTTFRGDLDTGRLASKEPSLLNIPARTLEGVRIRRAFIPDDGYMFLNPDYSQLEFRVMGHMSGDLELKRVYEEEKDMHLYGVHKVYGIPYEEVAARYEAGDDDIKAKRSGVKEVGFGLLYGKTAYGLSHSPKMGFKGDKEKAQAFIDGYLDQFPGIRSFMQGVERQVTRAGYVQTITGRYRMLRAGMSGQKYKVSRAIRQAYNTPIQGSAADLVKRSMIAIDMDPLLLDMGVTLHLQVHDEFLLQAPKEVIQEASKRVRVHMENPFDKPLAIPLVAEENICSDWASGKDPKWEKKVAAAQKALDERMNGSAAAASGAHPLCL
jgi:DNA polymerase-1